MTGRCIAIHGLTVTLKNMAGSHRVEVQNPSEIRAGDLVEIRDSHARVLTPNRSAHRSTHWMNRTLSTRRRKALHVRTQVERGIRSFFDQKDFLEVRTPLLVPCPGMEPHIRPFQLATGEFLPTSPEFAMKRLLVGGLERIYQMIPSFRSEPTSPIHHPEFLMLEWYRAYAGYEAIMADTEQLIEFLAIQIHGKPELEFQGKRISVKTPWPRLTIPDLFLEHTQVDLTKCPTAEALAAEARRLGLPPSTQKVTWDDLYFQIWLNLIEPRLPSDRAVIVYKYPPSQAALSVVETDPQGNRWARRFEIYAGGLELGNAFEELTDPREQRQRFIEDMDLRAEQYGPSFPKNPLDEEFLNALEEGMPPSGGIAVGVDRLVMLLADEPELSQTLWLDSFTSSR